MTDPIKPALTPEEWYRPTLDHAQGIDASHFALAPGGKCYLFDREGSYELDSEERHASAAICLYGQPFGFTWKDVEALRALDATILGPGLFRAVQNLADRIAALLPPREA